MKKVGKYFLMMVMVICMFSYMGVVHAATIKALDTNKSSVQALLTGKELSDSDKEKVESLLTTYNMYYKYEKIESNVYDSYKNGDSSASSTINGLISDPTSSENLSDANGWTKISEAAVSYEDLEVDSGYVICLFAYSSSDTGTLYYYKSVYQATSGSELALYQDVANNTGSGDVVTKNNANESTATEGDTDDGAEDSSDSELEEKENTDTEEKAETNPNTGISDAAVIIVPISLIAGTTLMIRRRFV